VAHTLSPHRLVEADPTDRTTSVLLRIGAAVLAVGLVAFGLLYYRDQHVAAAPSLIERQVSLTEAAVRKSPDDLQARLQLGQVYEQAARYDDAVAQFDQVLKAAPDSKDALLGKGFALMTQGELDKAVVPLTSVVTATRKGEFAGADSQLAAAYFYLGVIAVRQNRPDEALKQLGHALKIEPTDSDAMYQVGLAQLQQHKPAAAAATFRNALRFVPTGWCEPYQQLQAAYTAMKKPELATYASAMAGFCGGKVDQARTSRGTPRRWPVSAATRSTRPRPSSPPSPPGPPPSTRCSASASSPRPRRTPRPRPAGTGRRWRRTRRTSPRSPRWPRWA
jgi:tetratricopeptide (TPR) repeat protein